MGGPGVCVNREVAGVFDAAATRLRPATGILQGTVILVPSRSLWAVVIVGLVAALVLAYSVYQIIQPDDKPLTKQQATLEVQYGPEIRGAVVGHPFHTQVEIRNIGQATVGGIRLQVNNGSAVFFRLTKMRPQYVQKEEAEEWTSYIYPDMAPHERLRINLELVPRQPGKRLLAIRLLSRGTTFHETKRLSVEVAAAPEEQETGGSVQ